MTSSNRPNLRATVLGAGIVGVCCALYLQRAGFAVTLVDRDAPGEGTSSGNAGIFAVDAITPVGMPGVLGRVPKMLLDPLAPLSIRPTYLPRLLPWLLRFIAASRPDRVDKITASLKELADRALPAYETLLDEAGLEDRIRRNGWMYVFQGEADLAHMRGGLDLLRRHGVEMEELGPDALRQYAHGLSPSFMKGMHFPNTGWTTNPKRLCQDLAEHFRRRGGRTLRAEVMDFAYHEKGVSQLLTKEGLIDLEGGILLLAAGAHSRPLLRRLGTPLPLETERGYHVMLPKAGIHLEMPVMWETRGVVATPMDEGLRIAGTVEMGGLKAPPNERHAKALLAHAKTLFPHIETEGNWSWMGYRPSMPDSLPVIGRSPRHRNLYLAFGHGHLGLTLAAATGELIADMVMGRAAAVDPRSFSPLRFHMFRN